MDYDNRVYIENLELTHSTDLVQEIVENISELFTEMDCPEDDNSQVNTQTVAEKVI